jgi:hypothetical protein
VEALFPAGADVVRVMLQGTTVDAVVRLDQAEHRRRARCGLGAVSYPKLLRRLRELPLRSMVDDPLLRAETHLLPDGVVDRDAGGDAVARLLSAPLVIDAVVIWTPGAARRRHVRLASRYATYFHRWVVAGSGRVDPSVRSAAADYDVGLVVGNATAGGPQPGVVARSGPPLGDGMPEWAWCFAEQAYAAWLGRHAAWPGGQRNIAVPGWLIPPPARLPRPRDGRQNGGRQNGGARQRS